MISDPLGLSRPAEIRHSLISLCLLYLTFDIIDLIMQVLQHPKGRCQLSHFLIVFKVSDKRNLLLLIYEVCLTSSDNWRSSSIFVLLQQRRRTIIKDNICELFLISEEYFEVLGGADFHFEQAEYEHLLLLCVSDWRVPRALLVRFGGTQRELQPWGGWLLLACQR